jgi:hypothetical protein
MQQVFGGNQGVTPPVADNTPAQDQAAPPALPPSMQAQFERFNQAGQEGTPAGNFEAAQGALGNASSVQDIIAAMERAQRM